MPQSNALEIAELFHSPEWDLRAATEVRPETPAELHQYVRTYCKTDTGQKLIIPARRMCEGHQAPFEFVSDAFFGKYFNQFVLAPRSGGKTQDFGLLAFLGMKFLGRDYPLGILDVGGILKQAKQSFAYTASLWKQEEFRHGVGRGILKESIELPNGTNLTIGPATIDAMNSPHVPWCHFDEWELWPPEICQQAFSIPQSSGPHRAAVRIASTRKFALGNVQRFLDESNKLGYKVYKWCIWETIEQCRDRECSACPIFNWPDREGGMLCGGRAKDARGFYLIDDFIDKAKNLDRRTLEEEWLCLRPSREGLVYGREFSEELHRLAYELPYQPGLPIRITIDQGFTNPFAVLITQDNGEQLFILDELYQTEMIPEQMGKATADRLEALGVEKEKEIEVVYDPEDPAAARTYVKHLVSSKGIRYYGRLRRPAGKVDVDEWIRLCRRRLTLAPGKQPRFLMSSRCRWMAWEFTQYRYPVKRGEERPSTETPLDKDNHAMSAWYRLEAWVKSPKASSGSAEIM